VLRKEDDDWVKKCMEYEVEGSRPKRTWREVAEKDCYSCVLLSHSARSERRQPQDPAHLCVCQLTFGPLCSELTKLSLQILINTNNEGKWPVH